MLLKVGVVVMVLSLTLAAGATAAVIGLRSEAPETAAVSPAEPRSRETIAEVTAKKEPDNEKLEIDDEEPEPQSKPRAPRPKAREPQPKPAPREKPKPRAEEPAPAPLPVADWPRPTREERTFTQEPRRYELQPRADMTLTIDALGLYDVPVVSSDSLQALDTGLMHVPQTSFPWEQSPQRNVYIAGHYLGYPGTNSRLVFYNLDRLRDGDEVVLRDEEGRAYRYQVSESFAAYPNDSWVMGQEVGRDMLTLQTCIPPGFEERLVVRADRV